MPSFLLVLFAKIVLSWSVSKTDISEVAGFWENGSAPFLDFKKIYYKVCKEDGKRLYLDYTILMVRVRENIWRNDDFRGTKINTGYFLIFKSRSKIDETRSKKNIMWVENVSIVFLSWKFARESISHHKHRYRNALLLSLSRLPCWIGLKRKRSQSWMVHKRLLGEQ